MCVGTETVLPHITASAPVGHRILVDLLAIFQTSHIRHGTQVVMLFYVLLLSVSTNRDTHKEGYIGVLRIQFIGIHVDIWVFSTLKPSAVRQGPRPREKPKKQVGSGLQAPSVL